MQVPGLGLDYPRGATTSEVMGGKNNEPSQLVVLSASTKVVTVSVGGNDVGFKDFATACFMPTVGCDDTAYLAAVSKITYNLPANLNSLFNAIKTKIGTQTKVLVVGYPMLIPGNDVNTIPWCPYLTDNEKTAARDVIRRLNAALVEAIKAANNVQAVRNFMYVDPNTSSSPFIGRELCTGDTTYFNNITGPPDEAYSLHPNAMGQDAYRRLIISYMAANKI